MWFHWVVTRIQRWKSAGERGTSGKGGSGRTHENVKLENRKNISAYHGGLRGGRGVTEQVDARVDTGKFQNREWQIMD